MAINLLTDPCRRHRSNSCRDHSCDPRATYDRRTVEALLVANWNGDLIVADEAPEVGMPRARANPAQLGNSIVMMIDLRRAWAAVELDDLARTAVRLHYGRGLTHRAIASAAEVSQSTITNHINHAVSATWAWLNGVDLQAETEEGE